MRTVAILLFDEVEVLDFAGPFEVFSVCGRQGAAPYPFEVFTVAERSPVTARNHLTITPSYLLGEEPNPDIVLVPGGGGFHPDGTPFGSRREMDNERLLSWIRQRNQTAELVLSVCTGSLLLARAGLLTGLAATTHRGAVDAMRMAAPHTELLPEQRWVDNGRIILSAGVSAGIDMSLYVVGKLLGDQAADETARYMQYDHWTSS